MSLINELRAKSAEVENTKEKIIAEIKASFDKILDGKKFEEHLKKYIDTSDIKCRKTFIDVEFWEYHDGCSTTHFSCGGIKWCNPENKHGYESRRYKGIELKSINKEVGEYLSMKLENKMRELGFEMVSKEPQNSRFGYYDVHYYFGW